MVREARSVWEEGHPDEPLRGEFGFEDYDEELLELLSPIRKKEALQKKASKKSESKTQPKTQPRQPD